MKILFTPEEKYLLQIKTWLHKEMLENKSYFYYNFINSNFNSENFACCVDKNDTAIGYIDYTHHEKFTHIDIAVVQFEHQKKGIGRMLLEALSQKGREQGSVALSLMCAPKSSATKWKKLGFKKFKEVDNHRVLSPKEAENPWLYKIIIPAKQTTRKKNLDNYIELWTEAEYKVYSSTIASTYRWDITTLESSIVYPIDDKWKIKYVSLGVVVYEGVISRFKHNACPYGNFLVVDNLT